MLLSQPFYRKVCNPNFFPSTNFMMANRHISTTISTTTSPFDALSGKKQSETPANRRTPRRRRKANHKSSPAKEASNTLFSDSGRKIPSLTPEEYNPLNSVQEIILASQWNQGRRYGMPDSKIKENDRKFKDRKWDYQFVRSAVDGYEKHLQYVFENLDNDVDCEKDISTDGVIDVASFASEQGTITTTENTEAKFIIDPFANIHPSPEKCIATHKLLSPQTLSRAVRALTRCKLDTPIMSQRIRDIERLVGKIGWTPITDDLSYRLLEANGKAGNVRRTLALLELRRKRGYPPREQLSPLTLSYSGDESNNSDFTVGPGEKEFIHAINSIQSAQLPLRRSRNIYLHESSLSESSLDNPTRYLDAILVNMSQRGVPLTSSMAARMLNCYASTGRTGKALHYFYKVVRDPVEKDGTYIPGPQPTHLGKEDLQEWKIARKKEGVARMLTPADEDGETVGQVTAADDGVSNVSDDVVGEVNSSEFEGSYGDMSKRANQRTKVRMIMHPPPPFHKIPSAVKNAPLIQNRDQRPFSFEGSSGISPSSTNFSPTSSSIHQMNPYDRKPKSMTKLEWELEREWSLSLTAAFAFADSLTHGACGHSPIELDVVGWNSLIKACCYRGAFHRALKILNDTMPAKGIQPDSFSYNTVLAGLARVGDTENLRNILISMTNKNVPIDKYTVQAMVDGLLNMGDVSGASSMVQDIFNQHDTLPPYTTHLKIIEFALSNGLIFEAKRHVYFIQQLWKWQPSQHHSDEFCQLVSATKKNPKLSKDALQKLFCYFGEDLLDEDFF